MMREEIEEKAQRKAERKRKLRAAAVKDYMPGGASMICGHLRANPILTRRKNALTQG